MFQVQNSPNQPRAAKLSIQSHSAVKSCSTRHSSESSFDQEDIASDSSYTLPSESLQKVKSGYGMDVDKLIWYLLYNLKSIQENYGVSEGTALKVALKCMWNQERIQHRIVEDIPLGDPKVETSISDTFKCHLCGTPTNMKDSCSFGCDHFSCLKCFKAYIIQSMNEEVIFKSCYCSGCPEIATLTIYKRYLADCPQYKEYQRLIVNSLKVTMKDLLECPSCGDFIKFDSILSQDSAPITVKCKCCHYFCSQCKKDVHSPTPCHQLEEWTSRIKHKTLTNEDWIRKYTQSCPGCKVPIEKAQGNNDVICPNCELNFCWNCRKQWNLCSKGCESNEESKEQASTEDDRYEAYVNDYQQKENLMLSANRKGLIALENYHKVSMELATWKNELPLREAFAAVKYGRRFSMMSVVSRYFYELPELDQGIYDLEESTILGVVKKLEDFLDNLVDADKMKELIVDERYVSEMNQMKENVLRVIDHFINF